MSKPKAKGVGACLKHVLNTRLSKTGLPDRAAREALDAAYALQS